MIALFSVALILIQPVGTFACVPGLEWGMDRSSLEAHLGMALSERNDSTLEAQALQIGPDTELVVRELVMTMPACDIIGDFIFIPDLVQPLNIGNSGN